VDPSTVANCEQLLSAAGGFCYSCAAGFGRNSAGQCLSLATVEAKNCNIFANNDGSLCLDCANGYDLVNNLCEKSVKNCATIDSDSGDCTACDSGFNLFSLNNGDSYICSSQALITDCNSYEYSTLLDLYVCSACQLSTTSPFYARNQNATKCNSLSDTKFLGCKTVDDSNICLECVDF
jgi:hypothetical protein